MTKTGRNGDEIYPLLLDWRNGCKLARETALGLLVQEFTRITKKYAPGIDDRDRDSFFQDTISDFFHDEATVNGHLAKKLIPGTPLNPKGYRKRIFNAHCFAILTKKLQKNLQESIESIPDQNEINQYLKKHKRNNKKTQLDDLKMQRSTKRELLQRLIFWIPVLQRTIIAQFLGINPILWFREYAAHQKTTDEEAYEALFRLATIESNPSYRKAPKKERIRIKMSILFDALNGNTLNSNTLNDRYQKYLKMGQRELQRLVRWAEDDVHSRKAMLKFHHKLTDRSSQIVLGVAYELPIEIYAEHLKVFHLISADEAHEILESFDHRNWAQRTQLIAPYDEPQVGADAKSLFAAIDSIEKIARRESLKC